MQQDDNFIQGINELIQIKQKHSAFVYVRNHLEVIEKSLFEGAQISDIGDLLIKNGINITLPTLRLYLHRLRKKNHVMLDDNGNLINEKKRNTKKNHASSLNNKYESIGSGLSLDDNDNINTYNSLQSIKQQIPNLEELSKAFTGKK